MKKIGAASIAAAFALASGAAWGHDASGLAGGFASGFSHPFGGWDHVAAMVAVGLWAASLGRKSIWILPLVFSLMMACAAAIGYAGIHLPAAEAGIALSAIALGGLIAFSARPHVACAAAIVGTFAVFHGYAHGMELPHAADAVGYGAGFLIATALLHLAGIGLGSLVRWPHGRLAVRGAGVTIAAAGLGFLLT